MKTLPLAGSSWSFRDCSAKAWLPATVPGCVHTDLLRAKKIPDPFFADNENRLQWISEREWEYAVAFDVPAPLLAEEIVELVADGLDTLAAITLNGVEIARTENMFSVHRFDVKQHLRPCRNTLVVRFASATGYIRENRVGHAPRETNDPAGGCTRIRKQQCQFGWDWGPRLVTAGIWRDIRLEAWTGNRLASVRVAQNFSRNFDRAELALTPEFARPDADVVCRWTLEFENKKIAGGSGARIRVERPQLWWPNGHGTQPLYTLRVEAADKSGRSFGAWTRRIGLRTIALDRRADRWGESFRFVVNGRPIFAKGANWIPAHSFVAALPRTACKRDLRAAANTHMNMIRVWGGGVYESEDFYDQCDELGLLVWQDFMFACTLYPGDEAFIASVRDEAAHQIARLRHRACLALWCGNNEVWSSNTADLGKPENAACRHAYERLFHDELPALVRSHDGVTAYWPSSPWHGDGFARQSDGELRGDTHYWDVWHARHPVSDYEKHAFRFVSEFGMQSYSSPATNATFCPPGAENVFGPVMEHHQKNRSGNQIILDYVSRRYPFPKDQDALIYLSQLNQAHCMQTGVEHYRRNMPRCMGALYWQLNDCWPGASWSSIEFTGRWKALHYAARRFFAPILVTAQVIGDETVTIGNYRTGTVWEVRLFTVSDNPIQTRPMLRWELCHFDGRLLLSGRKRVVLRHGESVLHKTLDLARPIAAHGRDSIYLRVALEAEGDGGTIGEETALLTQPRFLKLPCVKNKTAVRVRMLAPRVAGLIFVSAVYQHRFAFDLCGVEFQADDNFFDLYPNKEKLVRVTLSRRTSASTLRKRLSHKSLADCAA